MQRGSVPVRCVRAKMSKKEAVVAQRQHYEHEVDIDSISSSTASYESYEYPASVTVQAQSAVEKYQGPRQQLPQNTTAGYFDANGVEVSSNATTSSASFLPGAKLPSSAKSPAKSLALDWNSPINTDDYVDTPWNEEFQCLLALPEHTWKEQLEKYDALSRLFQNFLHVATTFGKIIISERGLPREKKTVKDENIGGIAGGVKYLYRGILFKFCVPTAVTRRDGTAFWLYDNDPAVAAKAGGHELRALMRYFGEPGLCVPLMALIDYRGYRVLAESYLPISRNTLIYGSGDGGITVKFDNDIDEKMRVVAEKIHIKAHRVGRPNLLLPASSVPLLHGPFDIEVHRGTDGRHYVLDFARVFPPTCEENPGRTCLYQQFRPEFLAHAAPLSSDMHSVMGGSDNDVYNEEGKQATRELLDVVVPRCARHLYQLARTASGLKYLHSHLSEELHRCGVNVRYLGRVRECCVNDALRELLLREMVVRVLKDMVRQKLREMTERSTVLSETDVREKVIEQFNLVLSTLEHEDAVRFWQKHVLERMQAKYGPYVEIGGDQARSLSEAVGLPCKAVDFMQRLQQQTGVYLTHESMESLKEWVELTQPSGSSVFATGDSFPMPSLSESLEFTLMRATPFHFVTPDVERVEVRVKRGHMLSLAEARVLSIRSLYSVETQSSKALIGADSHRLFRLARLKYEEAARAAPDNIECVRLHANSLHEMARRTMESLVQIESSSTRVRTEAAYALDYFRSAADNYLRASMFSDVAQVAEELRQLELPSGFPLRTRFLTLAMELYSLRLRQLREDTDAEDLNAEFVAQFGLVCVQIRLSSMLHSVQSLSDGGRALRQLLILSSSERLRNSAADAKNGKFVNALRGSLSALAACVNYFDDSELGALFICLYSQWWTTAEPRRMFPVPSDAFSCSLDLLCSCLTKWNESVYRKENHHNALFIRDDVLDHMFITNSLLRKTVLSPRLYLSVLDLRHCSVPLSKDFVDAMLARNSSTAAAPPVAQLRELMLCADNLQEFGNVTLPEMPPLHELDKLSAEICDSPLVALISASRRLTTLRIIHCSNADAVCAVLLALILRRSSGLQCSSLACLDISRCTMKGNWAAAILRKVLALEGASLDELCLADLNLDRGKAQLRLEQLLDVSKSSSPLKCLRKLDLSGWSALDDEAVKRIVENISHLLELKLSDCILVTGAFLLHCTNIRTTLRELDLSGTRLFADASDQKTPAASSAASSGAGSRQQWRGAGKFTGGGRRSTKPSTVLSNLLHLESLCLSRCLNVTQENLMISLNSLTNIRQLDISGLPSSCYDDLLQTLRPCSGLHTLKIRASTQCMSSTRFTHTASAAVTVGTFDVESELERRRLLKMPRSYAWFAAPTPSTAFAPEQFSEAIADVLRRCTSLRELDIAGTRVRLGPSFASPTMMHSLCVANCSHLLDTGSHDPSGLLCGTLTCLDFSGIYALDDVGVNIVCRRCPRLCVLRLAGCRTLTDSATELIGRFLPKLQFLDLSQCLRISTIDSVADGCSDLSTLLLTNCEQISKRSLTSSLPKLRALRHLSLFGCKYVNDEIVARMCDPLCCPRLTWLEVGHNKASADALRTLQAERVNIVTVPGDEERVTANAAAASAVASTDAALASGSTELRSSVLFPTRAVAPSAQKAVLKGLNELRDQPLDLIAVEPLESNIMEWHVNMIGPSNTPYEGGVFHLVLHFPSDFPSSPPSVTMRTNFPHPHVQPGSGRVCANMVAGFEGHFQAVHQDSPSSVRTAHSALRSSRPSRQGWSSMYTPRLVLLTLQPFLFNLREEEEVEDGEQAVEMQEYLRETAEACRASKKFKCNQCSHDMSLGVMFPAVDFLGGGSADPLRASSSQFSMTSSAGGSGIVLSKSERAERDLVCFHLKSSFANEVLGFGVRGNSQRCGGLLVYKVTDRLMHAVTFFPRRRRGKQHRSAVKQIDSSMWLLSHSAFIAGQRDDPTEDWQFTHWIPAYINDEHGERALPLCLDSLTSICGSGEASSDSFDPSHALEVFPKLMRTLIVNFFTNVQHRSQRSLQAFFTYHRWLMKFVTLYPKLKEKIDSKLSAFVAGEEGRVKSIVPNIGDLLMTLTVSTMKWDEFRRAYLEECFDRNVYWSVTATRSHRVHYASLNTSEPDPVIDHSRNERTWETQCVSMRICMFQVEFLRRIARPGNRTLDEIAAFYDANYGSVPEDVVEELQVEAKAVERVNDWSEFFLRIGMAKPPGAAELNKWLRQSVANAHRKGYLDKFVIPAPVPSSSPISSNNVVSKSESTGENDVRRRVKGKAKDRTERNWRKKL